MFNFFNEIKAKCASLKDKNSYQLVLISNSCLYIEGFVCVSFFSNECIVLKVREGALKIEGQELYIKEMADGTIMIVGNINKVERA